MTDLVSTVSALAAALTADERALLLRALAPPRPRVAIVGLGCRFPGGAGPDDFWRLLARGGDAVREVPADRWDSAAYFAPDPDAPGNGPPGCDAPDLVVDGSLIEPAFTDIQVFPTTCELFEGCVDALGVRELRRLALRSDVEADDRGVRGGGEGGFVAVTTT